jgi:hypothetical protein
LLKRDYAIAWILVAQGIAGILTSAWGFAQAALVSGSSIFMAALALASLAAGLGWLGARRWAKVLALFVVLAQIPQVFTPTFQYFVYLGLQIAMSVGWIGSAKVGVNIVGLALFGWIASRFQSTPHGVQP